MNDFRNARKICWMPFLGAVIHFFYVAFKLRKDYNNLFVTFLWMLFFGLGCFIGILVGGFVCIKLFGIEPWQNFLGAVIMWVIIWPFISLPVILFSKYAERLTNKGKSENQIPKQEDPTEYRKLINETENDKVNKG